jgi:hypothetical protein
MTPRHAPRAPIALLEWLVPDSAPLAGDLVEEFEHRQSVLWLWWQVLAAIVALLVDQPLEIRPLRLVDDQPLEAMERTRDWNRRFRNINLSASPIPGVGGLGLLVMCALVTMVMPGAWWGLLGSTVAGVALGFALIASRRDRSSAAASAARLRPIGLR